MGQLRSTKQVRVGDTPEAFEALRRPEVLAVVWTGAWSEASLEFADHITWQPKYNIPGSRQINFETPEVIEKIGSNHNFCQEYSRLIRFFRKLSLDHLDHRYGGDFSRLEPAIADRDTNEAAPWHVDYGAYTMLSVPAGITTEILDRRIPGEFESMRFIPDNPVTADKAAVTLPNNAVIIFKSRDYPGASAPDQCLVHRRPNLKLLNRPQQGRMVIQLGAG